MSILRNLAVTDWRGARFAPVEQAGIALTGRMPMAALDFGARVWRLAGRSGANPVQAGRLDLSALEGATPGLVLEPSRTNLVFPSTVAPTGWGVNGGSGIAVNPGPAFGGIAGAVITSGTSDWGRAFGNPMTLTSGVSYAVSVWVAAGTSGKVRIELFGTGIDAIVSGTFGALGATYQAGAAVSNLSQTDLGGVWCIRFRVLSSVTATNVTLGIGPSSSVAGKTVLAHAAQVEVAERASSPIATTTAPVTRAADAPILPLGPWFNGAAGALRLAVLPLGPEAQTLAQLTDSADAALLTLGINGAGFVTLTGAGVALTSASAITPGGAQAVQIGWGPAGTQLRLGAASVLGGALTLPTAAKLRFGPANALVQSLYLWDRQV